MERMFREKKYWTLFQNHGIAGLPKKVSYLLSGLLCRAFTTRFPRQLQPKPSKLMLKKIKPYRNSILRHHLTNCWICRCLRKSSDRGRHMSIMYRGRGLKKSILWWDERMSRGRCMAYSGGEVPSDHHPPPSKPPNSRAFLRL